MSIRSSVAAWAALLATPALAAAQGAVRLREAFPAGYQYHVSSRVELTGELKLPPEGDKPAPPPVQVRGHSAIEYDERVLEAGPPDRPAPRTLRLYRRVDLERTVGDGPQESTLRPAVRRPRSSPARSRACRASATSSRCASWSRPPRPR